MRQKSAFKVLFICTACGLIFFFSAYLYLNRHITPAETKEESIPYVRPMPDNVSVLFTSDSESFRLFIFDFSSQRISAILLPEDYDISSPELYGYPVTYTVKGDRGLLAGIIDRMGGIILGTGEDALRYTGIQVSSMLDTSEDSDALSREIIESAFKRIAERGFETADFVYIIENGETSLTVPDCYYWSEYMREMCRAGEIIN